MKEEEKEIAISQLFVLTEVRTKSEEGFKDIIYPSKTQPVTYQLGPVTSSY